MDKWTVGYDADNINVVIPRQHASDLLYALTLALGASGISMQAASASSSTATSKTKAKTSSSASSVAAAGGKEGSKSGGKTGGKSGGKSGAKTKKVPGKK